MLNPTLQFIKRFHVRPRKPVNRIGLALGSGGARGIAHIAVFDYLKLLSVPVDLIAGSSIGAVVGALHCLGTLDDFKRDMFQISKRNVARLADFGLSRSGLMDGRRMLNFLTKYIPADMNIERLTPPLAVVATDLATGRPVAFTRGNLLSALRASISIPGIYTPVAYEKTFLVDGGVAAPLPIDIAQGLGADAVIAVNLSPRPLPALFIQSTAPFLALPLTELDRIATPTGWWGRLTSRRSGLQPAAPGPTRQPTLPPSIVDVIVRSLDTISTQALAHILHQHRPAVLIEPAVSHIYSFDFHRAEEAYFLGIEASRKTTDQLLRLKKRRV
jgi:NTE family protein